MSTYRSSTTQLSPMLADTIGTLEGQQDALLAATCPLSSATADYLNTAIAIPEVETRLHLASLVSTSLTGLGYALERVDGSRTTAFEARPANQPDRAHEVLLVVLDDDGRFETDHLGLADGTCNDIQRGFINAMEVQGALFEEDVNVQHHDPRGGSPITIARRRDSENLARGAALEGDSRGSFTKTLYPAPIATTGRVTEGGRR
jgi:hypothetical protein